MSKGACQILVETIWKASWFPGSTVKAVKNIGHDMKSLTSQVIEKSLPVKAQDIRWILGQLQLWVEGLSFPYGAFFDHFWLEAFGSCPCDVQQDSGGLNGEHVDEMPT